MNVSQRLKLLAYRIKVDSIRATTAAGSGHPTSCLSVADFLAVLLGAVVRYDYQNPHAQSNDRFILSKGHAVPAYYAALKNLGIISDNDLLSLRAFTSVFEGHPTPRFIHNQAATGSLGQGLAVGVGMALAARMNKHDYMTYVVMGDGETAEGSVWEAASLAAYYKLTNLVGVVDCNRLGQSDQVSFDHDTTVLAQRFSAFGWQTVVTDGHDIDALLEVFKQSPTDAPRMILIKTYKGNGLEWANKVGFHGKPLSAQEAAAAVAELEAQLDPATAAATLPEPLKPKNSVSAALKELVVESTHASLLEIAAAGEYQPRKAFGKALADMAHNQRLAVVDADVKNSTYTEYFEHKAPERFIQSFIAEQAMVGIATGLTLRGTIAFCGSFGAFLSRCFDQIRMAAVGRVPLRLFGSHAGVSIGEDGPSQMALEDIAMLRAVPGSVVLYPADGISAYKLTCLMAAYDQGISYLRTTRAALPTLYTQHDEFVIGGSKTIKQSAADALTIVAAGITVFHALKAAVELEKEGILCAVIDAYSVKPLDTQTLLSMAIKSKNKLLVVEDHYAQGGLGEAVAAALAPHGVHVFIRAVTDISRSGKPEELLAAANIDALGIIKHVKELV